MAVKRMVAAISCLVISIAAMPAPVLAERVVLFHGFRQDGYDIKATAVADTLKQIDPFALNPSMTWTNRIAAQAGVASDWLDGYHVTSATGVAYSQGALVARECLREHTPDYRLRNFISVCGANQGVPLAANFNQAYDAVNGLLTVTADMLLWNGHLVEVSNGSYGITLGSRTPSWAHAVVDGLLTGLVTKYTKTMRDAASRQDLADTSAIVVAMKAAPTFDANVRRASITCKEAYPQLYNLTATTINMEKSTLKTNITNLELMWMLQASDAYSASNWDKVAAYVAALTVVSAAPRVWNKIVGDDGQGNDGVLPAATTVYPGLPATQHITLNNLNHFEALNSPNVALATYGAYQLIDCLRTQAPPMALQVSPIAETVCRNGAQLTWRPECSADTYRLQVSTGPSFATTVADVAGLTSAHYTTGALTPDQTYYWRVRSSNATGDGPWCAAAPMTVEHANTLTMTYQAVDGGTLAADQVSIGGVCNTPITVQPKTVTVNGQQVAYVFALWDDGSTDNPRQFASGQNVTRTVIMKVHLASDVTGTSWANGERRICEVPDTGGATYHAAYASGGSVWYTRNRDNGGWEGERLISAVAPGASDVSLAPDGVSIAWLEPGGSIKVRRSADSGATWGTALTVLTRGSASNPIIYAESIWPRGGIAWVEGSGCPQPGPGVYVYSDYLLQPQLVPGTGGIVTQPAVCTSDGCNGVGVVELAFIRGGKIWEGGFYRQDAYHGIELCSSFTDKTSASTWTASNPSIACLGSDVYLVWEENYLSSHRLVFRKRTGGVWSAPMYFGQVSSTPAKPVIGIDTACQRINIFWQNGNAINRVTRLIAGNSWDAVASLGIGAAPAVSSTDAVHMVGMWTTGTAAPYLFAINSGLTCSTGAGGGGTGEGCPFVDTQTDTGWVVENSVLSRSLGGPPPLDVYGLTGVPVVNDGRVALRVRENEDEVSEIDRMRLVAVDHPNGTDVARIDGEYVVGYWHPPYQITGQNSDDLTEQLGTPYGYYQGEPGDTLLVWMRNASEDDAGGGNAVVIGPGGKGGAGGLMARGDNGPLSSAAIDAGILRETGIEVQQQDSTGEWETVRHIYPREFFAQTAIDTLLTDPIRLVFVGHHALRGVGWLEPSGDSAVVQELPLLTAVHTSLGDVQASLLSSDAGMFLDDYSPTVELVNGDTLNVEFGATAPDDWMARQYVLLAEGTYTTATGVMPLRRALAPPEASLRFALAQNRPNPFGKGTAIGFDLPRSAHVRLEIFDLQGRRVQTIADKDYGPGHWNATWNRIGSDGAVVRSGVYLYRLSAGAFRSQRKMVLLP